MIFEIHKARRLEMMKIVLPVLSILLCLSAYAENSEKEKISLTKAEVEKCVKTIPAFIKANPDFTPDTSGAGGGDLSAAIQGALVKTKAEAFAKKHGYSSITEFVKAMSGVLSAYSAMKIKDAMAQMKKQVSSNPKIKSMFAAQMKMLAGLEKKMKEKITPETFKAIEPYYDTLDKLFMKK